MTEADAQHRAWYKRPPVWVAAIVLAALAVFGVREVSGGLTKKIAYGEFFDQLAGDNIATVTFSGTRIDGRFKAPIKATSANDGAPQTAFRSQVPDWGDPELLPQLRKDHVPISVISSSAYWWGTSAVLGGLLAIILAKPMLLVIAAAFVAGLYRVARGGKMDMKSTLAMLPMFKSLAVEADKQQQPLRNSSVRIDQRSAVEDEMTDAAQYRSKRAWYRRPSLWMLAIVLVVLGGVGVIEINKGPTAISYNDFFNQVDAGNVLSVSISGTQVDGKFKQPVKEAAASTPQIAFRSDVPTFGDPALLPELRQHQVAVDVVSSSSWLAWLGRLPWPMVLIVVALLIAGLLNFRRGDKAASSISNNPMTGMVAGLFGKK